MPRYRYTATALSGRTLHGVSEAASAEALYTTLRDQDLYMTDAKESCARACRCPTQCTSVRPRSRSC